VYSGVFEEKVVGTSAAKIVTFVSKVVVIMYVTMGSYGYVTLVRRRKRKKWDPGGHFLIIWLTIPLWSSLYNLFPLKLFSPLSFYQSLPTIRLFSNEKFIKPYYL
jgi:hypothetical protein